MAGTVRARMRGGMLELLEKVDIPEGKEVSVTILETPQRVTLRRLIAPRAVGRARSM